MSEFFSAAWMVTVALAPWLLLGAVIAGAIHILLPRGFIRRSFTGRGGVLRAVMLGIPLPLCSCGVIPAGLGLKKDGASDGAAVGFLISTPQTGVDSVLVSATFLGWPFALFKVAAAALTGLVGGWLADVGQTQPAPSVPTTTPDDATPRTLAAARDHALDILRSIWRWLAFGILLSAFITSTLPPAWLANAGATNELVALFLALAISIPLYVCATASVPIAAALVAGGLPAGAALVFLMAGPATNLATLGAVARALGRRALVIYLGTIVLGSLGLAYAFDACFSLETTAASSHEHAASSLEFISALGLLCIMGWFALDDMRHWLRERRARAQGPASLTVGVEGMSCQGCVRSLTRSLNEDPRVESCLVVLEPGEARVHGRLTSTALEDLVRAAGFTPIARPGP